MAECLKCCISYDYGKEYCGQCGNPLIETKDIFNEATQLQQKGKSEEALEKILLIPSFSFFYDKAIFLQAKILSNQNQQKELTKLLIGKNSWAKIDFKEKEELKQLYLEQIEKENISKNYKNSLELLESVSLSVINIGDEFSEIEAETNLLLAKDFYEKNNLNDAEKHALIAGELGKQEGLTLYVDIRNDKVDKIIEKGELQKAKEIVVENLELLPESVKSIELKDRIDKIFEGKKRKRKRVLTIIVIATIIFFLGYLINYLFLTGRILLKINLSNSNYYNNEQIDIKIDGNEIDRTLLKQGVDQSYLLNINAGTGKRIFVITQKYFVPETLQVDISNSKSQSLEITLKQKISRLDINCDPKDSKVYINGVLKGSTPMELKNFNSGVYEIKIVSRDYYAYKNVIQIDDTLFFINEKLKSRILFYDTFDKENKGWENYSTLLHKKWIWNGSMFLNNGSPNTLFSISYLDREFTNFELIASMGATRFQKGTSFGGIQFGAKFENLWGQCYFLELSENNYLRFGKNNGTGNNRGNITYFSAGYNDWIKINKYNIDNVMVRIINNNGQIKIYINNNLEFSTSIPATTGVIALWCNSNSTIKLNEIKVLDIDHNQIE